MGGGRSHDGWGGHMIGGGGGRSHDGWGDSHNNAETSHDTEGHNINALLVDFLYLPTL